MELWHITYVVLVCTHLGMMSALAKRWHNETSSFHLPTGEAIVTLEDVWCISKLLIHGWQIVIYMHAEWDACHIVLTTKDVIFCEG